jgi:hypothetical protein
VLKCTYNTTPVQAAPLIDRGGPLTGSEMVAAVLGLQAVPGSEYD